MERSSAEGSCVKVAHDLALFLLTLRKKLSQRDASLQRRRDRAKPWMEDGYLRVLIVKKAAKRASARKGRKKANHLGAEGCFDRASKANTFVSH